MLLNPKLFVLPQWEIKQNGVQNLIYGSLTKKGLVTMVNFINKYQKEDIRGLDLGCGDGELIYNLQNAIPNSIWEGVEISEHRVSNQIRDVTIWQGDFLNENIRPYNILHADNLCLDDDIAEKLERKIAQEFTGMYITYRKPECIEFLKTAIHVDTVITETTWTNHPIHIYRVV